ncbi:MAG: class I SAM-dependent methyltransferase [Bacteroidia bacterium]|nr:class I SAM-dependent methyltransferase [Bacteroidia bacterium]
MIHYDRCPLCSSVEIEDYLLTRDYFLSRETFKLVKCSGCGFIFTQDHPDANNIDRYYASDDYISHNESATGFLNNLYRLSRRLMLKRKRAIVKNFTGLRKGTILDTGSGTGHFLSVMKEAGWTAKGVEINDKAREFSVSTFGLEVISPEQLSSLPSGSFDCITLWHVLEHFEEPFRYASEILRLLKPGGSCILALPNCQSFDAEHYKEFWAAYDVPRHLWHFTPVTLGIFAEKTGFNLKCTKSLPPDVFYISSLSEKYKGSNLSLIAGMINGLWFSLKSIFNKNRSSSLIYFIKKKSF